MICVEGGEEYSKIQLPKDFALLPMTNNLIDKGYVTIQDQSYHRFAVQTEFVQIGDSYLDLVKKYILPHYEEGDLLFISEKIISLSQKRVVKKSELKIGFWAKTLSKFVMKTTAGYSVGNVYKMQLAINLAGLPRILFAAFCSAATKPFGIKGVFYRVAGHDINGIDGFYGGAFSEYEELGILNPEKPDAVCQDISELEGRSIQNSIVDANDLGCNVLAQSKNITYSEEEIRTLLKGNPAGQKNQCTPFILLKPTRQFTTHTGGLKYAN